METKKKTTKESSHGWKELIQGFVANMLEQVGENVSEKVRVWMKNFKRQTFAYLLILVGGVFFLISVVLMINALADNKFPWVGWGLVGLALLAIGNNLNNAKK